MIWLETTFAVLSQYMLMPVLIAIGISLIYTLYAFGEFSVEYFQRRFYGKTTTPLFVPDKVSKLNTDDLELKILKQLEVLRLVSRTTPMLGLVATMIPLGPALSALGEGDLAAVGRDMALAFSAVIIALIAASGTFWMSTVRRRWLLNELRDFERNNNHSNN